MIKATLNKIRRALFPEAFKRHSELRYWQGRLQSEGGFSNDHYAYFYTAFFGLQPEFFVGKRILDIGCGPRGSLEWADLAAERVGLDPLADEYLKMGAARHQMTYVASGSEAMPFDDGHFDVVCSFNSLDHVSDLPATIQEIGRIAKRGGVFLLITDVNHDPTPCEPICFSWDIVEEFQPSFELLEQRRFEKFEDGVYKSIRQGRVYDDTDTTKRYGILAAKFQRA